MFFQEDLSEKQKAMAKRWEKLTAPIRPSKGMVELYERNLLTAIKSSSNSIWGLLGCTPEIRSIAGKYQAKIICIDHNPNAFHSYKVLSKPSRNEEFLCTDWCVLNLKEKFDIGVIIIEKYKDTNDMLYFTNDIKISRSLVFITVSGLRKTRYSDSAFSAALFEAKQKPVFVFDSISLRLFVLRHFSLRNPTLPSVEPLSKKTASQTVPSALFLSVAVLLSLAVYNS